MTHITFSDDTGMKIEFDNLDEWILFLKNLSKKDQSDLNDNEKEMLRVYGNVIPTWEAEKACIESLTWISIEAVKKRLEQSFLSIEPEIRERVLSSCISRIKTIHDGRYELLLDDRATFKLVENSVTKETELLIERSREVSKSNPIPIEFMWAFNTEGELIDCMTCLV